VDIRKPRRVQAAAYALLASGYAARHGVVVRHLRIDVVAVELWPAIGPDAGGPVIRHLRGVG